MIRFVTLGPAGGNHAFVLERYLRAHDASTRVARDFVTNFHVGAQRLLEGGADFMLQCAVHPDAAEITGRYRERLFVVDAFISPSRPMALLRARQGAGAPDAVGVMPATAHYADLSAWTQQVPESTVTAVGEGLVAGRYAAGIAFAALAEQSPDLFEVVQPIAPVCDAWIVYGRSPVDGGQAVVWTDSPVARLYASSNAAAGP